MKKSRSFCWRGIIREFRDYLPDLKEDAIVSLSEGDTPLLRSRSIASLLGSDVTLFFKYEGLNPTGSFKDRGMTLAVSKAVEAGSKAIICASTGNTSAAAAAYAAAAGIKAYVLVPEGKIALGKLTQAMIHGARVLQIRGNFDVALSVVREVAEKYPVTIVNSINPFRIEGQKSAAYEVCLGLEGSPDWHFIPVGNAGNITAYWRGYREFYESGKVASLPRMMGYQAEGAAPIVRGHPIEDPETVASAIRIGNPASWNGAMNAAGESGGKIDMVTDDEILRAYSMLAAEEGIFCEPASAASLAGVLKFAGDIGFDDGPHTVVCTLTGHGLKDPDTALKCSEEAVVVDPEINDVIMALGM